MVKLEREFALRILEKQVGKVFLDWDDLWLRVRAEARGQGEGLCKLWLLGEGGCLLLGTMAPAGGRFTLQRRVSMAQVRRCGVWAPRGVAAALLWPFRTGQPFPMPELFCFARVEGEQLCFLFDEKGDPVMPV